MNYLKEFRPVNILLQHKIYELIDKDDKPFEISQLYSSKEDKKLIDYNLRKSVYKNIVNDEIFNLMEKLVYEITTLDKTNKYKFVRNNITLIHYGEDDFFKAHEDYLTLTSNLITEYTMIICKSSDCKGGRTIFHINDFFTHYSEFSIMNDHILIFRKDIIHEGEILLSGHKDIITCNLWATYRESEIIHIYFTDDKYYVIPTINILPDTFFNGLISENFVDKNKIITHKPFCTYEEFNTIYKIIMGKYITFDEYEKSQELIKFYQINVKNILFTINQIDNTNIHIPTNNKHIIINKSEKETEYMTNIVKELNLDLIPFKIVTVEGTNIFKEEFLQYNNVEDSDDEFDDDPYFIEEFEFAPIYFSVGELGNLYYIKSLTTGNEIITPFGAYLIQHHNISTKDLPVECEKLSVSLSNWKSKMCKNGDSDRNANISDVDFKEKYVNIIVDEDPEEINENEYYCTYNFSGVNDMKFDFEICKVITNEELLYEISERRYKLHGKFLITKNIECAKENKNWCLDKDNKLYINTQQSKNLIKKLKEINFQEELLRILKNGVDFDLPQSNVIPHTYFCNEESYTNCKLMVITGFIIM